MKNISILLDSSSSMRQMMGGRIKIDLIREKFMKVLNANKVLYSNIIIGKFSDAYIKLGEFVDINEAVACLNSVLAYDDSTNIWDSVMQCLNNTSENTLVVCLTDGESSGEIENAHSVNQKLKSMHNVELKIIDLDCNIEISKENSKITVTKIEDIANVEASLNEIIKKKNSLVYNTNSISVPVIPLTECSFDELNIVRNAVIESVFYLEALTKIRYYPVTTYIVDEFPVSETSELPKPTDINEIKTILNFMQAFLVTFHTGRFSEVVRDSGEYSYSDYTTLTYDVVRNLVGYSEAAIHQLDSMYVFIKGISEVQNTVTNHYDNMTAIIKILENILGAKPEIKLSNEYFMDCWKGVIATEKYLNLKEWESNTTKEDYEILLNCIEDGFYKLGLNDMLKVFRIAMTILFQRLNKNRIDYSNYSEIIKVRETFGVYLDPETRNDKFEELINEGGLPEYLAVDNNGKVLICLKKIKESCKKNNLTPESINKFVMSVIIHEHTHALIREGTPYEKVETNSKKLITIDEYKIVNESIAEWTELSYFRNDPEIAAIILEHINLGSLPLWPYKGVLNVEEKSFKLRAILSDLRKQNRKAYKYLFLPIKNGR